jgi:hypothetical protein
MSDDLRAADTSQTLPSATAGRHGRRPSLLRELCEFAWENKKWWLVPVVGVLLVLALLVILADAGLTPFIYTLF